MTMAKYNTDLLDEMFKSIDEKLDGVGHITEKILEQTTKTNGRVSALENKESERVGYYRAISIFVIPTLMFLLYKQLG